MKFRLLLALSVFFAGAAHGKWVDDGDGVFFPPAVADAVHTFKSFPVFWWNFLVLEPTSVGEGVTKARAACELLHQEKALFERVECGDDLAAYRPLVADWAADVVFREPAPTRAALRQKLDDALARASLPMPKDLMDTLRADPLGAYTQLLAHARKRLKLQLERRNGFFTDAATGRIVIPVQPSFPPEQSAKLMAVRDKLPEWTFIGPHGATLENRERIQTDLERVSVAGIVVLVLFGIFLAWRRQWRLCIVFPPVFIAAFLSALTIRLLLGSVHGLVLAFGTGIIGLTVDYGLHLAYATHPEQVWRSNLAGFVTTMVCLVVLMFSEVPLLRQLMLFSALGFTYAYFFLWLTYRLWPRAFKATPLGVGLRSTRIGIGTVVVLFGAAIAGAFVLRPALDLRQLDYQTPRAARLSDWFFRKTTQVRPLFEPITGFEAALDQGERREGWRRNETPSAAIESPADYLPVALVRRGHLAEWKKTLCDGIPFATTLPENHRKLFAPFLAAIDCAVLDARAERVSDAAYLKHLRSGDRWLALWLPSTAEDSAKIEAAFPQAQSLFSIVSSFPKLLTAELKWMGPLSLFFVFVVLAWHFRSMGLALLGLLPFVAGTGAVALRSLLWNESPSFVTLVGLVMMLGLSVDYAIFVIDYLRRDGVSAADEEEERGAGTALWLSAVTTVAGFLPLIFCEHRVLAHLGWALVLGTMGTVACASRGLPGLRRRIGVWP